MFREKTNALWVPVWVPLHNSMVPYVQNWYYGVPVKCNRAGSIDQTVGVGIYSMGKGNPGSKLLPSCDGLYTVYSTNSDTLSLAS